ncbi:hypothetical protein GCM10009535_38080 [Streptomyces thermocarboxydovorans]|uniref:Integral membrane protein n=1 Tax=Streptomyces thermocarboxydovorans TaxID=59298 RepID=A0ABP3SNI4_9ACTN
MTPLIIVLRSTWQQTTATVPRCARCHTGHQIEQTAAVLGLAALIAYAASGQLDRLLGILSATAPQRTVAAIWAVVACLPLLVWIAIRQGRLPWSQLAPRRMGYARHHPEFLRLREEGWKPRSGPFPHWKNPPSPHPQPEVSRFRQLTGRVLNLAGAACAVAVPVSYFQGYEELAGGFILATLALLTLASKVRFEE